MTKTLKKKEPSLEQLFRYGQLAMQYTKNKDPNIAQQLREIEKELGMDAKEVMDEVMRHTDIFAVH